MRQYLDADIELLQVLLLKKLMSHVKRQYAAVLRKIALL
jgi:hypothetical protein